MNIALLACLRPRQWTKNLLVFAALIFARKFTGPGAAEALGLAALTFAGFCLASGALYVFNDIQDVEGDRRHPQKRLRPLASGRVSVRPAAVLGVICMIAGLGLGFLVNLPTGITLAGYVVLTLFYSAVLKHVVLVDVLTIAAGFVLRAVAGATALDVPASPWLLVCTTLLALFLGLSKRRHELVILGEDAANHRLILKEYSPQLLDQLIAVVTSSTVVTYALYTMHERTVREVGTRYLGLTIPFVLYGIFRYLYLIHQKEEGGRPERLLFLDRPLLIAVALWAVAVCLIVYLTGSV